MDVNDLLEINKSLFNKMKELAIKQENLINDDEVVKFINLSDQREHLKHEINRNFKRYNSFLTRGTDRGMKKRNSDISNQISDVIRSIQEIDQRIERLIAEKKEGLIDEAKRLRKGQTAAKGYGARNQKGPRFFSAKG